MRLQSHHIAVCSAVQEELVHGVRHVVVHDAAGVVPTEFTLVIGEAEQLYSGLKVFRLVGMRVTDGDQDGSGGGCDRVRLTPAIPLYRAPEMLVR